MCNTTLHIGENNSVVIDVVLMLVIVNSPIHTIDVVTKPGNTFLLMVFVASQTLE